MLIRLMIIVLFLAFSNTSATKADTLTEQDVREHYSAIKAEMNKRYEIVSRTKMFLDGQWIDKHTYSVFDCGFTEGVNFTRLDWSSSLVDEFYAALFELAKQVITVHVAGRITGYPESEWKKSIDTYEKNEVDNITRSVVKHSKIKKIDTYENKSLEKIVEQLNKYRKKKARHLPTLLYQEGCGAGEFSVDIITKPLARIFRLIPDFFANVCISTGKPVETNACPYWRDFPGQSSLSVSGLYQYEAHWNDGTVRRGKVDFDKLHAIGDDENAKFNIAK